MTGFHFVLVPVDLARQRLIAATVWLGLIATVTFLFFFNPAAPANQFFPACPFRLLTGLQCPGCGSTRALHQLLHGHPVAAFEFNPLLVISLPLLALALVRFRGSLPTDDIPNNRVVSSRTGWLVLAVVIGFWVYRNTTFCRFVS